LDRNARKECDTNIITDPYREDRARRQAADFGFMLISNDQDRCWVVVTEGWAMAGGDHDMSLLGVEIPPIEREKT
jgi:hypothetical protein